MRDAENWFQHYAAHQREPTLRSLHWLTVPCLALSVIGLLWSLPVPAVFERISPAMNWGSAFAMAAIVYYFIMSIPLGVGMTAMLSCMLAVVHWLDGLPPPLWATSVLLLAGALPRHPDVEPRKMFGYPCAFVRGSFWIGLFEANAIAMEVEGVMG